MKNLKKLRQEKRLTQKELAQIFNTFQPTILSWEKGTKEPDYKTLCNIANYFGVTVDYLLGREPESGLVYVHTDPPLTDDEKALLNIYRNITPELKENARSMIDLMPKVSQDKQIKKGG